MSSAPRWLRNYYGKDFDRLSPSVVEEGDRFAVVKLFNHEVRTSNPKIGYVLIDKRGSFAVSPHQSLFEGIPSQADVDSMKAALSKREGKA